MILFFNFRDYSGSPEVILKHPLENCWTLWYFKNDRSRGWEENQKEVKQCLPRQNFFNYLLFSKHYPLMITYIVFKLLI